MSRVTDTNRIIDARLARLQSYLSTYNMSIGFTVIDGPSLPEAKPVEPQPSGLSLLGGIYSPLSRSFTGSVSKPYVSLKLTPEQSKVIQDTSKNICVVGGQRSGKTQVGFYHSAIYLLTHPNSIVFYLLPSYSKEDIITDLVESTLFPWITTRLKKEHRWLFANGSQLRIFSVAGSGSTGKSVQGFLGYAADRIVLEEFREFQNADKTFNDALSRVITRNGGITIVSSPEPGHMLEDIAYGKFKSESFPEINFSIHRLSTMNSVFAKLDKYRPNYAFEIAKQYYPKNRYRRDVLGEFVPSDNIDYYEFDTQRHVVDKIVGQDVTPLIWSSYEILGKSLGLPPNKFTPNPNFNFKYIVGLDPGYNTCSATIIKATMDNDGFITVGDLKFTNVRLTVIAELQENNTNLLQFLQTKLTPLVKRPSDCVVFADPAVLNEKNPITAINGYTLLKQHGYTTFVKPSYDSREDVQSAMNSRFKLNMLHIGRNCRLTVEHLTKVTSREKSMTNISRDPYGHLPDSIKYVVGYLFPWWRVVHETGINKEISKVYQSK